jgi:hypothetical protein
VNPFTQMFLSMRVGFLASFMGIAETDAHMRRAITLTIAAAIMCLLAFMFSEVSLSKTGKDTADARLEHPDYTITDNPYLPIHWLRPVW